MSLQNIIDEENLIQSFIDKLLDKKEEKKREIEMRGYPATWLDDPMEKKTYRVMKEGKYCSFEILTLHNSKMISNTFDDSPDYLLDFGTGKVLIKRSRLKLLLDTYDGRSHVTIDGNKYSLFTSIPIQAIINNASKIVAS